MTTLGAERCSGAPANGRFLDRVIMMRATGMGRFRLFVGSPMNQCVGWGAAIGKATNKPQALTYPGHLRLCSGARATEEKRLRPAVLHHLKIG
jgi:hypothetical protein